MKAMSTDGNSVLLFMSAAEAGRVVQLYNERAKAAAEVDDLDRAAAALCLELGIPFTRPTPAVTLVPYVPHPSAAPIREAAAAVKKAAAPKQRQPETPPTKPDKAKATAHRPAATSRPAKRKHVSPLAYSTDVRTWAAANGFKVNTSGRMSEAVVEAYQSRRARPAAKFSG